MTLQRVERMLTPAAERRRARPGSVFRRRGRFRVLDAFSCKGGTGSGWMSYGADVLGVDVVDYSADYPGLFVQADAVDFIRAYGHTFDLVSIGAPCQFWTRGMAKHRATGSNPYPRLIAAARHAAEDAGVPYVIENVADARPELVDPILLCGRMFRLEAQDTHPDAVGMRLILDRHRLFEFGGMPRPPQPAHPTHTRTSGITLGPNGERLLTGRPHVAGVYGGARRDPWEAKYVRKGGYVPKDRAVLRALLGVEHIDDEASLFEAIPPAYIRWVANQCALALAA